MAASNQELVVLDLTGNVHRVEFAESGQLVAEVIIQGLEMFSVALDPAGNIYLSGDTDGIDLPTSQQAYQATLSGTTDAFAAKFGGITTPTITSLSAPSGLVGAPVTISDLNFGSSGTVTFNGVSASSTSWSATSIVVTVPAGAKTGNVVVTSGGLASNGVNFTILAGTLPIILVQHARKAAGTTTSASLAFAMNNTGRELDRSLCTCERHESSANSVRFEQ